MGTVLSQILSKTRTQDKTPSSSNSAVTMLLATVTVLAVVASSVSAMDMEYKQKQIPHYLPFAFPLSNGTASTCQTLCKMSPDCQYFVFMEYGEDLGTCHFGKRPITSAISDAWGFFSGTPDGPILPNTLVLADIEAILFMDGSSGAEQCYRICLETENCHHWYFTTITTSTTNGANPEVTELEEYDWCYLDSRTDIRGNMMITIHGDGGDRNTPPAEDTTPDYPSDTTEEHYDDPSVLEYDTAADEETAARAGAKKTQKQGPKKKPSKPSNPATKLTQNLF